MAQEGYFHNLPPAGNNSPMGMAVPQTPYDGYYNQNSAQFPPGNFYNVRDLELQNFAASMQQARATGEQQNNLPSNASFGSNARDNMPLASTSRLTATAAEFTPSARFNIETDIAYNRQEDYENKGAIPKNQDRKRLNIYDPNKQNKKWNNGKTVVYPSKYYSQPPENKTKYNNKKQERNNYNPNFRKENSGMPNEDNSQFYRQSDSRNRVQNNPTYRKENNSVLSEENSAYYCQNDSRTPRNYRKETNVAPSEDNQYYRQNDFRKPRAQNPNYRKTSDENMEYYRQNDSRKPRVQNPNYRKESDAAPSDKSNEYFRQDPNDFRNPRSQNYRKENTALAGEENNQYYRQNPNDFRNSRAQNYNRNFRGQDYNNREFEQESRNESNYRQYKDGNYRNNYRDSERNYNNGNRDGQASGYKNWRSETSNFQEYRTDNLCGEQTDYASKREFNNREKKPKKNNKPKEDKPLRERLIDQVNRGILECLVCVDLVKQGEKIWDCKKCYTIFHFKCITKWGNTSKDAKGWRCPACQHVSDTIPKDSFCYCGKLQDPPFSPMGIAHSCGEDCGKLGMKEDCSHPCNLLCHPGPCPICEAMVSKKCNCGVTTQIVKCNAETILVCSSICRKYLKCGVHLCKKICHGGDCEECLEIIDQECYCGENKRTIPCEKEQENVKQYSCQNTCNKTLSCGNHKCEEICHPGDCPTCDMDPSHVKTCPCGKKILEVTRTSCLDEIPCCEAVCGKIYPLCGSANEPHFCKSDCHIGDCPPCSLSSFVRCRCGHMSCEIQCKNLKSRTDDARCEKKCIKKRSCGRHKCNQLCCIDIDHTCPILCNKTLSCGHHRCEETCHRGRCQQCSRLGFDELFCECGASVIYPPIPCGTRRPACQAPCSRRHGCEHEALHTCHSHLDCPPCTYLTTKTCYGGHEQRKAIPCHVKEFSCGLPCGKDLPCGKHKCQIPCHSGPCLKPGQSCMQSCATPRDTCGHPCGQPCHTNSCPESPCKELVKVTCQCGLRSSSRVCVDMVSEYKRIETSMLASKMADMQLGRTVTFVDLVAASSRKLSSLKTLECNEECRVLERNKRLAIGLQIRNPDLSSKLTPRYSDFMRQWAKKDQYFCQMVHDKLAELVQLAKQSKQKSRSFSFPSANRDKRQFIHEYCEHFGCESAAYDQEPNRNVVATAARDKAWMPSYSLLEVIQRENGQRKVPGPILNRPLGASKLMESVSLKVSKPSASTTLTTSFASTLLQSKPPQSPEAEVDYFNYPTGK